MIVLGIETSCDDTAVGIVDVERRVLANCVASQTEQHQPYGGVVPEIAARAHLDLIDELVRRALKESGLGFADLSGIAATCGPGLIGGVMVGAMTGKAIAAVRRLPFIGVNHLEAHALTPRLTNELLFPYLLLLLSGGHSQILLVKGIGAYLRLGGTIDDAVGECFDKGAKLLGLGYPGGPLIERAAATGNAEAYDLPRPMLGREGCDFSFSGLKTALRQLVEKQSNLQGDIAPLPARGREYLSNFTADAAASLQKAITDILANRAEHALKMALKDKPTALVVAGGVAANLAIRARLQEVAAGFGLPFVAPALSLCTDNGAMVAWAGVERLRLGLTDPLDIAARPRWPLDALAQQAGKR
jgi:N6-L-threonylcarbamoyladenine synthase